MHLWTCTPNIVRYFSQIHFSRGHLITVGSHSEVVAHTTSDFLATQAAESAVSILQSIALFHRDNILKEMLASARASRQDTQL